MGKIYINYINGNKLPDVGKADYILAHCPYSKEISKEELSGCSPAHLVVVAHNKAAWHTMESFDAALYIQDRFTFLQVVATEPRDVRAPYRWILIADAPDYLTQWQNQP